MEKEDKIFDQFKSAADNAETKDFPGMENVWQRVEGKLDKKILKKENTLWKKIAVAACILLVGTLGFQFLKNNQTEIKANKALTEIDSIKKTTPTNDIVTAEPLNPAIKKDAAQILQKQIIVTSVAVMEVKSEENYSISLDSVPSGQGYFTAPTVTQNANAWKNSAESESRNDNMKDVEMLMAKKGKISNDHKEEPLVIIDNKATKKNIKEIEFADTDSLVVLNEPLYIINGVEYTEKEVFGPNPTSPYTPLNKQEIETLSILQDEKAIEIYGNKGKKGVVIITTKNGKPVSASKKAK